MRSVMIKDSRGSAHPSGSQKADCVRALVLPWVCHLHLHLLLGSTIPVTDNCNNTTEFHPKIGNVIRTPTPIITSYLTGRWTQKKGSEIRNTGRAKNIT